MSHPDQALDSAVAYHLHVQAGLRTARDYRTAAALADKVADILFTRAAEATTTAERRTLAAEVAVIGEQVIGR